MGLSKRMLEMHEMDQLKVKGTKILYESGYIKDSRCQGIARQVISQGTFGLSSKQKYLYQLHVEPLLKTEINYCQWCSDSMLKSWAYEKITNEYGDTYYWCSEDCWDQNHKRSGRDCK